MIVVKPAATAASSARPSRTPPASVLCRICGETIFSTTGKPISRAMAAASPALVASPSRGDRAQPALEALQEGDALDLGAWLDDRRLADRLLAERPGGD